MQAITGADNVTGEWKLKYAYKNFKIDKSFKNKKN